MHNRLLSTFSLFMLLFPVTALAALPPFELARKRVAQVRAETDAKARVTLVQTGGSGLRQHSGDVELYSSKGVLRRTGKKPGRLELDAKATIGARLLWIAILAPDPVGAIESFGTIDAKKNEVVVEDAFQLAYGGSPRVFFSRTLDRLLGFRVTSGAKTWSVSIDYAAAGYPERVQISRDGTPHLTARIEFPDGVPTQEDED